MTRISVAALLLILASGCAIDGPREPLAGRVVPCPCTVSELERLAEEHPGLVIHRDRDGARTRYHPGSFDGYRLFDPEVDPVAGNQCTYDSDGRLITAGPAAGTPDRVSPTRSVLGHWWFDVRPFRQLGWREYHRRGWAPISSADCD